MLNYIPTTQSGGNLPTVLKSLSGQPWHTSSMLTVPSPKYDDHSSDNTSNSNLSKNLNNQPTPGTSSPSDTPTGFAPTDTELSGGITGTGLGASAADAGAGLGAGIGDLGAGGAMDFGWLAALFA